MKVVGDTPMNPVERLLSELDEQQRAAVTAPDGPVMVFAGAGSGKTRVLTYRIAYLLLARRIPPHRLFAVTFTNKAAEEMRQRLEGLVGKAVEAMWLGTFHAACARMLRQHGQVIGLPPNFVIYDEDDQRSLLKAIFKELNLDTDRYPIAAIHAAISHAKNEMVTPDELMELAETPFQQVVGRVYRHYQEALRRAKAVDFDDLLWLTLRILPLHCRDAQVFAFHVKATDFGDDPIERPLFALDDFIVIEPCCLNGSPPTPKPVAGFSEQSQMIPPCPAQFLKASFLVKAANFGDDLPLVPLHPALAELLDVSIVVYASSLHCLPPPTEKLASRH